MMPFLKSVIASTLLVCALLFHSAPAKAECTEYVEPKLLSRSEFLEPDRSGALGVLFRKNYLLFDRPGCYDAVNLGERTGLSLFLNNYGAVGEPSYLAALTVTTRDYALGGPALGSLNLRRNKEDPNSPDRWVRFVDDPEADVVGTSPNGGDVFKVGGYEKAEAYTFSRLGEIAPLLGDRNQEATKLWHAFVGDRDPRPHYPVRILADSMASLPFIAPTPETAIDSAKSVAATAHLVKFRWSDAPSLKDALLDININGAKCLYLKYYVIGSTTASPDDGGGDYIRIRLKDGAAC